MRSQYQRENCKVKESSRSDAGAYDIFDPKWARYKKMRLLLAGAPEAQSELTLETSKEEVPKPGPAPRKYVLPGPSPARGPGRAGLGLSGWPGPVQCSRSTHVVLTTRSFRTCGLNPASNNSLNTDKEPPQPDECRSFGLMMESCARSVPMGADRQLAMLAAHRIMVENSIAAGLVMVPEFLSVSARGSPTNWSHDDGAVFFRHPDGNLQPANHSSTAPSCPGIKFIENLVHTTLSAGTSTAAAIKELPLRQRASGHGSSAAMKLLMFFVLPQFLSVSARGSPTNWSHDDGAVFFRHPDGNLQPANHSSTAPSCPGIKFIENLVHTTLSAGTSTAAAIKELPLRQRASGHGSSAAMKLLMFFVLPQFLSVSARGSPTNWSHDDGAVFFRHPDGNLQPANHSSTAPSCPGIKFIENLVHTTLSAGTSTAAAIKELPLRQRASGHGSSAAMKLLMFFVLPQFLSVSARGSPTNWSHDDGAVFFRHPDGNLQPANHSSTAPSCPGIKFIENLVHTTSSAGTSTAAAIKELPLRQRASGHGSSAAMKLLMFFVLPQVSKQKP
ncbi:uncharacterized protein ISCGN_007407 [Ixodes scapularis]